MAKDEQENQKQAFKEAVDVWLQRELHKLNVPSNAEYNSLEIRIKELESH
ncbi:hypothetical protein [Paenibacillus sp. BAC0078]